jgi:hypothetical protein
MPLAVKLLAGGLGLLAVIYGLTLFRDHEDPSTAHAPVSESQAALVPPSVAPAATPTLHDVLASAPMTSASVQLVAASPSASAALATPMAPSIATRMKSVVAAINGHKAQTASPSSSAVQPNVAAALVPAAPAPAVPADSAVK